jgi:hypothetical protein
MRWLVRQALDRPEGTPPSARRCPDRDLVAAGPRFNSHLTGGEAPENLNFGGPILGL